MKIVDKNTRRQSQSSLFWLLLVAGALLAGILLGNAGAIAAMQEAWQNLQRRITISAPADTLPVIVTNINFQAYNQLLGEREQAVRQGVLSPGDSTFVSADIQHGEEVIPVWIRLLPGTADHLGTNDKWNYELVTRDEAELLGISHGNLIDPADNNWLTQWAFNEALRHAGLQSGDYQFLRLILNGDDKGLYALQEDLRPVTGRDDGQSGSVVLSYDFDPLLEAVSSFGDADSAAADPVSNLAGSVPRFLQVAEINDPLVSEDELLAQQAERGTALLRGLQSGQMAASEVFDAQTYGRFLALVDLWGAHDALSPFNVQYLYDGERDRLQPLVTDADPLAGEFRLPAEAMYNDPLIQEAYVSAVAEFSSPAYLGDLREAIGSDYSELERALAAEINTPSLWEELAARQELLKLSLRPAQPVVAQLGSPALAQEAIIRVNVANALNLPLEILGFDIDGATFLPVNPEWIINGEGQFELADGQVVLAPAASATAGLNFITFDLPLTEIIRLDEELDFLNEVQIQVATSIVGLDDTQLTTASPGLLNGE